MRECGLNEDVLGKSIRALQAFKRLHMPCKPEGLLEKGKGKQNVEDIFRIRIFDNRKEDDGAKIVRDQERKHSEEG